MFIEVRYGGERRLINLEDTRHFEVDEDGIVWVVHRDGQDIVIDENYDDIKRALRNCGEFILE